MITTSSHNEPRAQSARGFLSIMNQAEAVAKYATVYIKPDGDSYVVYNSKDVAISPALANEEEALAWVNSEENVSKYRLIPAPDSKWIMYCILHQGEFASIFSSKRIVQNTHQTNEPVEILVKMDEDQTLPESFSKADCMLGWLEGQDSISKPPTLVFKSFQFNMCWPYGWPREVERKKGWPVRLKLERIVRDQRGRGLLMSEVGFLAEKNARVSSDCIKSDESFEDIVQWATDVDGYFDDDQVEYYDLKYIAESTKPENK